VNQIGKISSQTAVAIPGSANVRLEKLFLTAADLVTKQP
jgi:hypothetical protein